MRDDLDFLYQKAMRSKDMKFINEVIELLVESKSPSLFKINSLLTRMEFLHNAKFDINDFNLDRFSMIIGDSLMGENWYRNR